MTRARNVPARHKRRKKILKEARGFSGGRSKLFRTARDSVKRSWAESYRGRKLKKRDFRRLWITRIRAGVNREGLSYSKFMGALTRENISLNRKILAEMAVDHSEAFSQLIETVK